VFWRATHSAVKRDRGAIDYRGPPEKLAIYFRTLFDAAEAAE
jgi:hypothetical protein